MQSHLPKVLLGLVVAGAAGVTGLQNPQLLTSLSMSRADDRVAQSATANASDAPQSTLASGKSDPGFVALGGDRNGGNADRSLAQASVSDETELRSVSSRRVQAGTPVPQPVGRATTSKRPSVEMVRGSFDADLPELPADAPLTVPDRGLNFNSQAATTKSSAQGDVSQAPQAFARSAAARSAEPLPAAVPNVVQTAARSSEDTFDEMSNVFDEIELGEPGSFPGNAGARPSGNSAPSDSIFDEFTTIPSSTATPASKKRSPREPSPLPIGDRVLPKLPTDVPAGLNEAPERMLRGSAPSGEADSLFETGSSPAGQPRRIEQLKFDDEQVAPKLDDAPDDGAFFPDDTPGPAARPESPSVTPAPASGPSDFGPDPFEVNPAATPIPAARPTSLPDMRGDGTAPADVPRGLQEPRLSIEKIAPTEAVIGKQLVYSVIVKNIGGSDARQVVVEDRIPQGTDLVGVHPKGQQAGKRLIWQLGTIKPNESRKISVQVIPREAGPIGSVAKVNFVAEIAAEVMITAPQLAVDVFVPQRVKVGEPCQVTFRVKNSGKAEATDAIIRDVVPVGFQHPAGEDVEYHLGTLGIGESREIVLELIAMKPGLYTNKTSFGAAGSPAIEDEQKIEVQGEQLNLVRNGPRKVFVGRDTQFTNVVKNVGNAAVDGLKVRESVPRGMEFVDASDGGQYDAGTCYVEWTVSRLQPDAERAFKVKLRCIEQGATRSEVIATSNFGTRVAIEPEVAAEGLPSIAVESNDNGRLIAVGEQITTQFSMTNRGSAAAKNVRFAIELPDGLRFVSLTGPLRFQQNGSRLLLESIPTFEPREVISMSLTTEGMHQGDNHIRLMVDADHFSRPQTRDELVQVIAEER